MVCKMKTVGFSYPEYEHFLNYGMVYYYLEDEYIIGGPCDADFSEQDRKVAQEGVWLPDTTQLLSWLDACLITYKIHWNSTANCYNIEMIDELLGAKFCSGGIILVDALAKGIIKLCKAGLRKYVPHNNTHNTGDGLHEPS